MHFGMWKRHKKLADRERCEYSWDLRYGDSDGHVHCCKVYKGHTGHHACRCGSGTTNAGVRETRVGARA